VVIAKDDATLEPPHHSVVEGGRPKVPDAVRKRIEASLAGHGEESLALPFTHN
jgi:hypothetical protein